MKFNPVPKDRLFYNQYLYCVAFELDEVSCLKIVDHEYVTAVLARRTEWRDLHRQRLQAGGGGTSFPSIHTRLSVKPVITEQTAQNLHDLVSLLLSVPDQYKLVTTVDRAWLYSNDSGLIHKACQLTALRNTFCSQAVINRPVDTVLLKKSSYAFRSYFRTQKLSAAQKTQLDQFLHNQQDHIRISPAAREWLAGGYLRTQDYFFIDHAGEAWLVMLALVNPGLLRKTLAIITG